MRDHPLDLPNPNLLVVWAPGIVQAKLQETQLWVQAPLAGSTYERPTQQSARGTVPAEYLRALDLRPGRRFGHLVWLTPCPRCGGEARWLIAHEGRFWCRQCAPGHRSALMLAAGIMQFALLLGLRGRRMWVARRKLEAAIERSMRLMLTQRRMVELLMATPLLEENIHWLHKRIAVIAGCCRPQGLPKIRRERGPLWHATAPLVMEAMIDELLRPDVYLHRYSQWVAE